MKQTVTTYEVAQQLFNDDYNGWDYEESHFIADALEEWEDATGEELEFNPVDIRCSVELVYFVDAVVEHEEDLTEAEVEVYDEEEEVTEEAKEWLIDNVYNYNHYILASDDEKVAYWEQLNKGETKWDSGKQN